MPGPVGRDAAVDFLRFPGDDRLFLRHLRRRAGLVPNPHERQRDLWAFLVHRPATRTQIFLGKILAGVTLYLLAAGLPLAVYLIWMLTPGHVAAPLEWAMLQPAAVLFLSGILYYFAGLLTGLRQARWYASRALGLGRPCWFPLW